MQAAPRVRRPRWTASPGRVRASDAAYCQSPLCVASRISVLAGKHAPRCSAWDNGSRLYEEHTSIARHLSNHGYTTALIGKAHLHRPNWKGGFDHRPYGDLYTGPFCFHQPDPPDSWVDNRYTDHEIGRFRFAGPTQIPESMIGDAVVTAETVSFLLEHQTSRPDTPWMVCAGSGRPHFPLTAPARYIRRALENPPGLPDPPEGYPDSLHPQDRAVFDDFQFSRHSRKEQEYALACYHASLHYLDDCIGRLLDDLRRAGLLENTCIVYTSDHGDLTGEHGLWWKRSYYDASARVPLLIAGDRVGKGQVVTTPVELVDLFPTFCELAGIDPPENIDGESLLSLCAGRLGERKKRVARCDFVVGIEEGGRPLWFRGVREERWKYVDFPEGPPRLFDVKSDPGEHNVLFRSWAAERSGAPIEELRKLADACGGLEHPRPAHAGRPRAQKQASRRRRPRQQRHPVLP